MSATGTRSSPADPWRIGGSTLPPNLLLSAKLLAASLLLQGYVAALPEPFVPLLPWLLPPRPDLVQAGLQVGATGAALLLLGNRRPKVCALVLGGALIFTLLATRGEYRNSKFFVACILILIGLYAGKRSLVFLRAQFVLVYLGSGVNKLLDADWGSGRYFHHWQSEILGSGAWDALAERLPPLALGQAAGWVVIVSELALGAGFAFASLTSVVIVAAMIMHAASVLMAGTTFGIFFAALLFSFPVLIAWPRPGETTARFDPGRRWHATLAGLSARVDREGWVAAEAKPGTGLELRLRGRTWKGARAAALWLLLLPATWFTAAVILAAPAWLHWGAT